MKKLVASVLFLLYSLVDLFTEELPPTLVLSLIVFDTLVAAVFIYFSKYFDYYSIVIYSFCIFLFWGGATTYSYGLDTSIFTTESLIKFWLSYPKGINIASSLIASDLNLNGNPYAKFNVYSYIKLRFELFFIDVYIKLAPSIFYITKNLH